MSSEYFNPTRAIVLSEMETRDKEKYYNLLLDNHARFFKDGDSYVANVRLLPPGVAKYDPEKTKAQYISKALQLPYEERLEVISQQGQLSVVVSGTEQFDYSPYPRFVALSADDGDVVTPKNRILSWVMKIIEDVYDTRWEACNSNRNCNSDRQTRKDGEDDHTMEDENAEKIHMKSFPVFVIRRLSLRMGLKRVVDQNCWDLLLNVDKYRKDYLEVELFARFLQEFYDHDVLLFYLYVRSMVANVLHVNFKSRWSRPDQANPKNVQSLWMSYRECITVSKIIFGEENSQMIKDFLALLQPHLVGQRTEQADSRRIDITQFLHLAVVGYHEAHPSSHEHEHIISDLPPTVFNSHGHAEYATGSTVDSATGGDHNAHAQHVHGEGDEDSDADHGDEWIVEQFTNIQQDREREFLDFICQGLDEKLNKGEIKQEIAEVVLNKLYYNLRVKINASVGSIDAFNGNVDAFDDALVQILRADTLRSQMESMRDELIRTEN